MRELLFSYPSNPNRIRDLFRGNDFTAARLFAKNLKNLVQILRNQIRLKYKQTNLSYTSSSLFES